MFDMHSIGRKIAELRLQKDLTQMELADLLNISFQAVSNWERGISMPDISKLPELGEIFGVSIDEVLGKTSALLESVSKDQIEVYLEKGQVTATELSEVAPVLKPSQVQTIFRHTELRGFDDVVALAPFLSTELLDDFAKDAESKGDYKNIVRIAPFLGEEALHEIAATMFEKGERITSLLPFLNDAMVEELAEICYGRDGFKALQPFFAFLPSETLHNIAEREYALSGASSLGSIAPFLSQSKLIKLAERIIEQEGLQGIQSLAPFLSSSALSCYVKEKLK